MYTWFVDFQKAYDSIRPDSLKHKLEKLGIKGNFLDIITSIYNSTKVWFSYNSYVSTPFGATIGFKQGDILSTMFFNLFINDLPMLLEKHNTQSEESESPELFNTQICFLLFADDLVIFSLAKNGLQEKLDLLKKYCRQWDLNLNLEKTKVVILNKQGNTIKKCKFYYRGKEIEIASQYTYLDFTFVLSGKKHVGIENLIKKGKEAWFSIQKMSRKSKGKISETSHPIRL